MERGRVISDVGVLDLRRATEETIAGIARIDNVGALIFSRETAALVGRMDIRNVGSAHEIPSDVEVRTINGHVVFSQGFFKDAARPSYMLVNGHLRIDPDIEAEDIETGLQALSMNGHILCPDHLVGVLQSKIINLNGHLRAYAPGSRLAIGRVTLDESYVGALEDGSVLVIAGRLNVPRVLSNGLIRQKLRKLQVAGRIRCHEENEQSLLEVLDDRASQARLQVVPEGFELVERPLAIDQALARSKPARRIYSTDLIRVDPAVNPDDLDNAFDAIATEDLLVCPAALQEVVARKCNLLETRAIFYEGELWLVDGEATVTTSRLNFLEGRTTLMVAGALAIDDEVEPGRLFESFEKIHNLGEISCSPEQRGAIEARLGLSDGDIVDSSRRVQDAGPGDVGYLAL